MNLSRIFVVAAFLAAFSNLIADQFDAFQTEQLAGPNRLLADLKKPELVLTGSLEPSDLYSLIEDKLVPSVRNILQKPLYAHTRTPYSQNILDLPALYRTTPLATGVHTSFFFDKTNSLVFGNHDSAAARLLNIDQFKTHALQASGELEIPLEGMGVENAKQAVLEKISTYEKTYENSLIGSYAQEHRLGIVVDAFKCTEDGLIAGVRVPIYYAERNWNTSAQQPEVGPQGETKKLYPYVVDDIFGIDDMRLVLGAKIIDDNQFTTVLGTEITIPSGIALKHGVLGTDMIAAAQPTFADITKQIESLILTQAPSWEHMRDITTRAIHQLGAIGLGTPLGHEHHPSIAVFADQHAQLAEGVSFFARMRGTALLPHTRSTYLTHIPQADDFNLAELDYMTTPEKVFEQRLNFLSYMLTRNIFPVKADIATHIRFMSQFMCGLAVDITPSWQAFAGAEVWHMTTERIKGVYPHAQSYYPLKTDGLERPECYQAKIFGGYTYTDLRASGDLHASMCIDSTLVGKGIGNNTTVSFTLSKLF